MAPEETTGDQPTRPIYADFPESLHKATKDQAYIERRSVAALVREAVEQYLERATKPKAKASA